MSDTKPYRSQEVADELNYCKQHILNVATANGIQPQTLPTAHGNPWFFWTREQIEELKKHLGGKRGRKPKGRGNGIK